MLLCCTAVSALVANAVLARFPRSVAPDTIIWASALVQAVALALATAGSPVVLIVAVLIAGLSSLLNITRKAFQGHGWDFADSGWDYYVEPPAH